MGFLANLLFVYAFAEVLAGGAVAVAAASFAIYRRRSRISAFALDPSAPLVEGAALLVGVVEPLDEGDGAPVITVEVISNYAPWITAVNFSLRLPSGALVRVEPEADPARLSFDQLYHPGYGRHGLTYSAAIRPGDQVHLQTTLRREIDPLRAGNGYRDAARVWTARAPRQAPLAFVSARAIALDAERARFHQRWALGLGAIFVALNTVVLGPFHLAVLLGPTAPVLGGGTALLTLATSILPAFAYWLRTAETRPWIDRALSR
jgi:hypothetical protein